MIIFTKIEQLHPYLEAQRKQNKNIGFVPTMGALHQGHISLIKQSKNSCDITVCSIFVNPTQFNDKNDLARYPRMPEKDTDLLKNGDCDVLFLPSINEIYPQKNTSNFDFGYLDKILEGEHRPGHFNGVAQVVKRFFEIIQPHKAFFGSKDYQQVMVVKALVKQMNSKIEIIACPILREADGLAMSSRNALLSEDERQIASIIPKLMMQAKMTVNKNGIEAAKAIVIKQLSELKQVKLDYYEICSANTLCALDDFHKNEKAISLIAVFVGKIRLIDNLELN